MAEDERKSGQNRVGTLDIPSVKDPHQPADFDPIRLGRMILRATRVGSLGTLDATGTPLVTLVSVATDLAGAPILLVSGLSAHTKNLAGDSRCSLLLSQPGKGDPLAHPRLTLVGHARWIREDKSKARVKRRFLARHPKAQLYVDFPDFAFLRLEIAHIHLNGGFARAYDGMGAEILSSIPDEAAFDALEQSAVTHLNETYAEALTLYAQQIGGAQGTSWRATGLDPHGLDLARGDEIMRIPFDAPLYSAAALHQILGELARKVQQDVRSSQSKGS